MHRECRKHRKNGKWKRKRILKQFKNRICYSGIKMFTENERKQVSTIILGGSGSGKTNYVNIMVMNPEFIYDKIYVYTPNKHEWKIKRLNSFFGMICQKK